MNNEFKEIPGFPEYIINSKGEVYSKRRYRKGKFGTPTSCGGKRVVGGLNSRGYPGVLLSVDGKKKRFQIHRLVAMAFIPNPENKKEVNHKDGNPLNFAIDNLEWVTSSENRRHAFKTGIQKFKITPDDATLIRELKGKLSVDKMAKAFEVTAQTIKLILRNKIWKREWVE